MLLLLRVRVVPEDLEPFDLNGDGFRDPRQKALKLLPKVGIPVL